MSDKVKCLRCQAEIQQATAEATGGLCRPCKKWFPEIPQEGIQPVDVSSSEIERLTSAVRARCLSKLGVTKATYAPENYGVLGGFLSSFAQIFRLRSGPEALIRCRDDVRDGLQAQTHAIKVSDRMSWGYLHGWSWVDILLDGSIDQDAVLQLIDDSYALSCNDLGPEEKACISLLEKDLDPPMLMDELLQMYKLSKRREEILASGRPGVILLSNESQGNSAEIGASKIGGLPDLPASVEWPVFSDGRPLSFLAQINLAGLSDPSVFPSNGLLSIFSVYGWQSDSSADPALPSGKYDQSWTKILLHDVSAEPLARRQAPESLHIFEEATLAPFPVTLYPADAREPSLASLKWRTDVKDKYESMIGIYNTAIMQQLGNPPRNLLFGYADYLQDFERDVAKLDMRLLFQLASDDNARMSWGDDGYLYFWVSNDDLRQGRLDRVLTGYQCN